MSTSVLPMLPKKCRNQFCFVLLFLVFLPIASTLSFNFPVFDQTTRSLIGFEGDAFLNQQIIELTKNNFAGMSNNTGRAVLNQPLLLWDSVTGNLTSFTTDFSLRITTYNEKPGDGIAFFLSPHPSVIPPHSAGAYLGLFPGYSALNASRNALVAVEFDTYQNSWDPSPAHIGININSIRSATYVNCSSKMSINHGTDVKASVSYNSGSKNLSVIVTYSDNEQPLSLSCVVDLRDILPNEVAMGFSAATGMSLETHKLLSWGFSSTLEGSTGIAVSPGKNNTAPNNYTPVARKKGNIFLFIGLVSVVGVALVVFGLAWFIIWWKKAKKHAKQRENLPVDEGEDDEFERERGPRRFTFIEFTLATNNFSEEGKLGKGGFGVVYKGLLNGEDVAIKRISAESRQGKKEYISEVKTISRLRHRNLVQLVGWCHNKEDDKEDFLLAYKFMPNRSLDCHLHNENERLSWPLRYKIASQLASALLYLHEEWEQCVVHRDIKPSNVMLDSAFNAKLGDFGLARLIDHEISSQTTNAAGTPAYMAPEIYYGGKATKESDVFSFGVVALEIASGRNPTEAGLVDWVWELYGKGCILEAVDESLQKDFDEKEMERLMVAGLWCAHPYPNQRPSIRQAVNTLNCMASLPELPLDMPILVRGTYASLEGSSSGKSSAFATANSSSQSSSSGCTSHSK